MKCLIIAAGRGSRLSDLCDSKPLLKLGGKPLIEHVLRSAYKAGLRDFVIITGYNGEKIRNEFRMNTDYPGMSIKFIDNSEWKRGNGLSVYRARTSIEENFVLLMSDHIFDTTILRDLINVKIGKNGVRLAVDKRTEDNPLIDIDDVTKVYEEDGVIVEIGKDLKKYNCYDTGIFLCTPSIFGAIGESINESDESLSGGIRRLSREGKAEIFDIGERFWLDIDDRSALSKASEFIECL